MEASPIPPSLQARLNARRYFMFGLLMLLSLGIVCGGLWYTSLQAAPADFPVGVPITIPAGASVAAVVQQFAEARVVESEFLLYTILLTQYRPEDVKASTYVFDQPYDVWQIADKLVRGDYTSNLVRFTHREGERVRDLALTIHATLPHISTADFIAAAAPYEGYLFPETYYIPPHYTVDEIVTHLRDSYTAFVDAHQDLYTASALSEETIVTLASIVEREANSPASMRMVAGILQNRLASGMPLQADATIGYIIDTPLAALPPGALAEALKDTESLYNTYTHNGLPPTPIGNPGRDALLAVLAPTPSDYLFYITGDDGEFYYATTYDEHRRNIAKHLQ